MIGIAFSLGFTVGPLLGAYFAISSTAPDNILFQTPALLALAFSVGNLFFIWFMLPETLSADVKVGTGLTILQKGIDFSSKSRCSFVLQVYFFLKAII